VTVVLLGKEHEQFERAMAGAKEELGRNARRGQCLERVCEAYLQGVCYEPPTVSSARESTRRQQEAGCSGPEAHRPDLRTIEV